VALGVAGGFTQANHGRSTTLRRLGRGDWIAFYSPRTAYPDGEPLGAFTALGQVEDEAVYQAEMSPTFHPWRRRLRFVHAEEAPIRPLIDQLDFIGNKRRWGFPFRRGLFEVGETDLRRIAGAMGARLE
jgi:hypothetical protein